MHVHVTLPASALFALALMNNSYKLIIKGSKAAIRVYLRIDCNFAAHVRWQNTVV